MAKGLGENSRPVPAHRRYATLAATWGARDARYAADTRRILTERQVDLVREWRYYEALQVEPSDARAFAINVANGWHPPIR